ncbi:hypothetical protein BDQ17DRAFT_1239689 [Cyathus striatus]|nr:hypothetical protein BDQ17DRAFT_1239689 [Cyathus striatus]
MASRTLQPSEYEIQREVEALRDIRRRSTTPGALAIDPDLPNQSPPSSPTSGYWSGNSPTASSAKDSDSSSSSHEDGSTSSHRSHRTSNPTDDPFHLFWVPASLHPEIAPAEFRAFLKEHARAPSTEDSDAPGLSRSPSSSSSLARKKSMLSRQYRPSENDGVEEEHILPLKRNRTSLYVNRGPQLTINDLQRLEELAEEASESDDPSKLRNVLRRSLSLNLSPLAIDKMDEMPEMGDEADAPIIVPPPGQILRRAARTKIRKPGLPGDGGGHRFGSTRRGTTAKQHTAPSTTTHRSSGELSSSDHGELDMSPGNIRRKTFSDEGFIGNGRPDSYSEETSIYDAYARDEEEEHMPPMVITTPAIEEIHSEPQPLPSLSTEVQPSLLEALGPVIHQPQPQRLLTPQSSTEFQHPSRTPSPQEPPSPIQPPVPTLPSINAPASSSEAPDASYAIPASHAISPTLQPHSAKKDKDKKGIFKWGSDKSSKKSSKEKDRENRERVEKEKDSGFFGSLFGGKKKQDVEYPPPLGAHGPNAGREAAQALLGQSKSSKSYVPPSSPGLAPGPNPYARYPIHVERAIYRLSHIKLANPRRPLYEQVLISNLMFWYLGVINKSQSTSPPAGQNTTGIASNKAQSPAEMAEAEQEQKENEQKEKAEKERLECEKLENEQKEREIEMKKKETGRRGSLTKIPAGGQPGGGRRAEMAVKGPQYEMQHRVMEQEYGNYGQQGVGMGRPLQSPVGAPNGPGGQQYHRMHPQQQQQPMPQYPNNPSKLVQPQPQQSVSGQYYYQPDSQQQRLPPGAMAPMDQSWMSQQVGQPVHHKPGSLGPGGQISPSAPRPSRSPPNGQSHPMNLYINSSQESLSGTGNRPGRSLSATAVASPNPTVNGNIRKGKSAHAVTPGYGQRPRTSEGHQTAPGEEEDVPLAVWQQQRRK